MKLSQKGLGYPILFSNGNLVTGVSLDAVSFIVTKEKEGITTAVTFAKKFGKKIANIQPQFSVDSKAKISGILLNRTVEGGVKANLSNEVNNAAISAILGGIENAQDSQEVGQSGMGW